ncbi:MAG: phosphate ABC transporter permease subunit PstC [Candidatus Aminicenantes bacterium]|uniref:Phosphate transport system permease protein n=1 Tax=Candidatus Saccharicenans subterraneus TaxID=2508984 RepID=A0A3E2BQ73_9BACT|nr:phosphate ABC transporter permease subunit PstC [Candidatus Aminicenantes bacterium]RFT16885.1 MAG: Phosphate transport system permease protein PstC [Candidatus Saccharicenans subterraneum]
MAIYRLSRKDRGPELATAPFAFFPIALTAVIFLALLIKSWPLLSLKSLSSLIFSTTWLPSRGHFGLWPFVLGTLWVTITAFLLAVPVSILTSLYLSEYAPARVRRVFQPVLDLLAGLPSVIYGMWGVLVVVPLVGKYLAPVFGHQSSGYSILAASLVLALMILPTIISVSVEVLNSVPLALKEAALSLGATRFEVIRYVVMKKSFPGILAACGLGLSRAFGETIAVLMVVGNVPVIPRSLFSPAYPLPALLANNYGEMMSIPGYESALNLAALLLLVIVVGFSLLARWYLVRISRRSG